MTRTHFHSLTWLLSLSLGLLPACGDDSSGGNPDAAADAGPSTVEIFSWWVAPGEAEALQAVISLHRTKFPDTTIVNASTNDPNDVRDQNLQTRLGTNDQPDLFQVTPAKLQTIYVKNTPDSVMVLDSTLATRGWDQALFAQPITDFRIGGDKLYGIPTNLNRISGIYFNKQIFQDANVDVASITDWTSFIAACDAIKANGVAPIATAWSAGQGWILRILFDTMVLSTWGGDFFQAYYGGTVARTGGSLANQADIDKVKLGVDRFEQLLANYVNADADTMNWDSAAQKVIDGTAAMFPHGDWAKGLYVQKGKTPGVEFDVFSPPGDPQKTFLYGVDGFSVATKAKNLKGALDFLDTFLSEEGQIEFCKIKGASPVRKNVNTGKLDAVAQKNAQAMGDATVTMQDPGESWGYLDPATQKAVNEDVALNTYATTRTTDPNALQNLYDFFLTKAHKL